MAFVFVGEGKRGKMKVVKINGIEYPMSASVLTIGNYQNIFGMEENIGKAYGIAKDSLKQIIASYKKVNDKFVLKEGESTKVLEATSNLILNASKLAYVLIKEENKDFMPYEEFAKTLNNKDIAWTYEVVGIASCLF